ncbi:MAG: cysteine desulfurase IscS [Melioribacteraceae bacterium]|nr:MAG: cysteine desulfurase IscS [Melioribacteraceae bacterium]
MRKRIYLDNAATTPLDERVFQKMLPYIRDNFGNPSSIHSYGREVRIAIEEARETIADIINADPSEIYFFSSGTEANNFALFGIAKTEFQDSGKNKIISSKAEHKCVLEPIEQLAENGFNTNILEVLPDSTVSPDTLSANIDSNASTVSLMHINNETGGINQIKELAKIAHDAGAWFHTDAVQSFGKTGIDVKDLGVDSISVSAHKIFGPKGSAFTFAKSGTPLSPMIFGGSQERNRRGGTENSAAIIGMAEAAKIAVNEMEQNYEFVKNLKSLFCERILNSGIEGVSLNSEEYFSPYIISLTLTADVYNTDAEALLMYLDINGIAASNGAACTSGTLKPSHVILASGKSVGEANGTIRFSLSPRNTDEEIKEATEIIIKMCRNFRL